MFQKSLMVFNFPLVEVIEASLEKKYFNSLDTGVVMI